jgi:hypothetical protein
MIWSVPIEIRQKSRVLLAYSNPSRNRKKTANTGCLMRRLRYSVFKRSVGSREEKCVKTKDWSLGSDLNQNRADLSVANSVGAALSG